MEIKEEEYVRTKNGIIAKLEYISELNDYFFDRTMYKKYSDSIEFLQEFELDEYIVKHSFNIIDLIEEGDYVNGMEILHIEGDTLYVEWSNEFDDYTAWVDKETIQSIVTKEMMKSVEYRID